MSKPRARMPQAEIARALKAAHNAGLTVRRFDVSPEGALQVFVAKEADDEKNEWDILERGS